MYPSGDVSCSNPENPGLDGAVGLKVLYRRDYIRDVEIFMWIGPLGAHVGSILLNGISEQDCSFW